MFRNAYNSVSTPLTTSYHIDSNLLSPAKSHRDLGIILSLDLSWNNHFKHITAKAYRSLGLLRRIFVKSTSTPVRKTLYISLVRSQLTYGSQLWNPHFIKDIINLERVQQHATCFILNDFNSDYKSRLLKLELLPLMYQFDYYDVMFFITSLKYPSIDFNITNFLKFSCSNTRSSTSNKLCHIFSSNNTLRNFYFNRFPRIWNSLPPINLNQPIATIKHLVRSAMWNHFLCNFNPDDPCTFHFKCTCRNCYFGAPETNFK